MAKDKKLTIIDIGNVNTGGTVDDGSSPNYYTNPTQPQSTVEKKEKSGGSVFGKVILILFGAVVVFGAGVIVGFILCQKRMNEDGYDAAASDTARSRRVSDIGSAFSSLGSRFGRSVYDDDDDDNEGDYYNDRISGKKQAPAKRAKPDEDDDIDTSYFGRAAESQLGRKNVYDDVYDDYVPGSRSAKKNDDEDDYGSYDFLGSRSRRERSDDGYGSFSNEQTAAEEFDDGDDDDDDGFYADRRRYR